MIRILLRNALLLTKSRDKHSFNRPSMPPLSPADWLFGERWEMCPTFKANISIVSTRCITKYTIFWIMSLTLAVPRSRHGLLSQHHADIIRQIITLTTKPSTDLRLFFFDYSLFLFKNNPKAKTFSMKNLSFQEH